MNKINLCAWKTLRRCLLLAAAFFMAFSAHAQNTIEAVSGTIQGGMEVVRIELSQALSAAPSGFAIQSPARIALDFPGFSNGIGRSTVEINQGNLKSVSVAQAGERSRVVLNLKAATTYKTQQQGKVLLVFLDPVVAAVAATTAAPVFAENRNRDSLPLKDMKISFA